MARDRYSSTYYDDYVEPPARRGPSPGKVTLTQRLGAGISRQVIAREVLSVLQSLSQAGEIARAADGAGSAETNAAGQLDRAANSSGQPLPEDLRTRFEDGLGTDLSAVRVHTGGASSDAARAISARAYTVGQDIHFGAGQYAPDSDAGQKLLAHEVVHTVQQQGAAPMRQDKLEISQPGDALETEADSIAEQLLGAPQTAPARVSPASAAAQRQIMRWNNSDPMAAEDRRMAQTDIDIALSRADLRAIIRNLQRAARRHRGEEGLVTVQVRPASPRTLQPDDIPLLIEQARRRLAHFGDRDGGRRSVGEQRDDDAEGTGAFTPAAPDLSDMSGRGDPAPAPRSHGGGHGRGRGHGHGHGHGAEHGHGGGHSVHGSLGWAAVHGESPRIPVGSWGTVQFQYSLIPAATYEPEGGEGHGGGEGGEHGGEEGGEHGEGVGIDAHGSSHGGAVEVEGVLNEYVGPIWPGFADSFEIAHGEEGWELSAGIKHEPWDLGPVQVGFGINILELHTEHGEPHIDVATASGEIMSNIFELPPIGRVRLKVKINLRPNWRAIGRSILEAMTSEGGSVVAGAAAEDAALVGVEAGLGAVALPALLGTAAGVATAAVVIAELENADQVREYGEAATHSLYYYCMSYTGAFFGAGHYSRADGDAGAAAARRDIARIASDHNCTVADVHEAARRSGARDIYRAVFDGAMPRYRDQAAERVGSVRRFAPLIEGQLMRAQWGHSEFRRLGGIPRSALTLRRRIVGHADDQLAQLVAGEQPQQRLRCVLQPLGDGHLALQPTLGQPAGQLRTRLGVAVRVVEHDESLHPRAVDQQRQIAGRAARGRGLVVVVDGAADHHPRPPRQPPQRGLEHRPADVVEVDVDAVGARRADRLGQVVAVLVVDGGVEAEHLGQVAALVRTARTAHRATAVDLGQLADHAADRARRRRHQHGVARLGGADVEQAEVGGQPGQAEHPQIVGQRRAGVGGQPLEMRRLHGRVALHADDAVDEIANRQVGAAAVDDPADTGGAKHLAQLHRWDVRADVVHPPAHRRIERQIDHLDHDLAVAGLAHGRRHLGPVAVEREARAGGRRA